MNLTDKEKQQYYRYPVAGLTFKEPPVLDRELLEALAGIGDNSYRLNWGGVAVVRDDPRDPFPVVRGGLEGTEIVGGHMQLITGRLHMKAKQPRYTCYRTEDGKTARTTRPELIPPGRFTWLECEYIDFGRLFWYLERRVTPEQALRARVITPARLSDMLSHYPQSHPNHPKNGIFIPLMMLSKDGLYAEPDRDTIESVRAAHDEFLNGDTAALAAVDIELNTAAAARAEEEAEARAEESFDEMADKVIADHNAARVYLLPRG